MSGKKDIDILKGPELEAAFVEYLHKVTLEERRYRDAECKLALMEAEGLEREKKFVRAGKRFTEAIKYLLGPELKAPLNATNGGGVRSPVYVSLTMDECLTAMTCANGASRCFFETDKLVDALEWTTEVDVLHKNARFKATPVFDWDVYHPNPPVLEFHRQRLLGLLTASDVFLKLGNTGAAAYCRNLGNDLITSLASYSDQYLLRREVLSISTWRATLESRHPDPSIHRTHDVVKAALQVRGAWQKLKATVHSRIASRMAHACFIYKSRLYVCGGQRSGTFEIYKDLWCLDLNKMDRWRELPSYSEAFLNCQMAVHDGKAYLFRGYAQVDYFDLERERWGRIQTHFLNARGGRDAWPWTKPLTDYVVCAVHGKMYVFGGTYKRPVGSNLFAVLDIARKTWTRLSGTLDTEPLYPSYDVPGPRKQHGIWVDGKGEKIYVMYGMADRQAAQLHNTEFASADGFAYDDCWSWDIAQKRWQRERVAGNFPCPRAEMSVCYNPKINSTIMFGGYNPALPYYADESMGMGVCFGFSYFSDTFILDHSTSNPTWKQVLTPSFPTYRAQGQLLADPATGKIYGDIWQLVVDVPGGLYENIDWNDEKRCAQLGPWQVCYKCKAVGIHKRCKGSCGGRVFYCTTHCQKEGWQEHKEKHGCRK